MNILENKYVKRLVQEWEQHGKIIIAVDFDDTISPWKLQSQEECNKIIQKLITAKEIGAYISVFTACNTDRYPQIRKYCKDKGLNIDSININPINLPYGNQNKIYANIFIDDRAGLEQSLEYLEAAMYYIRSKKLADKMDYPGSLG
jgi:hypothetical protein